VAALEVLRAELTEFVPPTATPAPRGTLNAATEATLGPRPVESIDFGAVRVWPPTA
jgi:hypothetical protein